MNEFLTFAAAPGSNVLSQELYEELAAQATGFQKGLLPSNQVNKVLRQAAMMASAIAQLTADKTGQDVLDDGDRASLIALLEEMIGIAALEYLGAPLVFKGTWNATTNTPALASGVGTAGWMYTVSVAGNTNLDGINTWNVGDKAVFNGTAWERIEGDATEVLSVAGRVGAVVLTVADVGIASQAEAEAGLVNDKAMTPLRTAEAIAALSPGGGGGMTGEIVELIGAGPHIITAAHYGKTLRTSNPGGAIVTVPQTSTEAIPLPFFCQLISATGGGTSILAQGEDVLEGKGTSGPQTITVEGGAATIYKRINGSPNTYTVSGELSSA